MALHIDTEYGAALVIWRAIKAVWNYRIIQSQRSSPGLFINLVQTDWLAALVDLGGGTGKIQQEVDAGGMGVITRILLRMGISMMYRRR